MIGVKWIILVLVLVLHRQIHNLKLQKHLWKKAKKNVTAPPSVECLGALQGIPVQIFYTEK